MKIAGLLLMILGFVLLIAVQIIFKLRIDKLKKRWEDPDEMS